MVISALFPRNLYADVTWLAFITKHAAVLQFGDQYSLFAPHFPSELSSKRINWVGFGSRLLQSDREEP